MKKRLFLTDGGDGFWLPFLVRDNVRLRCVGVRLRADGHGT